MCSSISGVSRWEGENSELGIGRGKIHRRGRPSTGPCREAGRTSGTLGRAGSAGPSMLACCGSDDAALDSEACWPCVGGSHRCLEANHGDESMKTPENLVKAVERLKPQAVLLLDTNILMDYPQFASHRISAQGPFLLVIPEVVSNELLGLTFNRDQEKKQKASRAHGQLAELYAQGNPATGIDRGNGVYIMTASAPRPTGPEGSSLEDDQAWRYLGQVDAALLRLADACAGVLLDTPTVLITKDKNLTHVARSRGLAICPWTKLQSPEAVDKLLLSDDQPDPVQDIDAHFASLFDSAEERSVRVGLTVEELRAEDDYLIARGVGLLTDGDTGYPFRWTYPYKNAGIVEDTDSLIRMMDRTGTMPMENVDFFGAEERLQEELRRHVCSILIEAGSDRHPSNPTIWHDFPNVGEIEYSRKDLEEGLEDSKFFDWKELWERGRWSLQPTHVRIRLAVIYMECTLWGYVQLLHPEGMVDILKNKSPEEARIVEELIVQYYDAVKELIECVPPAGPSRDDKDRLDEVYQDFLERKRESRAAGLRALPALESARYHVSTGYAYLLSSAYLNAFQSYKALAERLGFPVSSVEIGLTWLLDVATDSWSVGETREREFMYSPFSWPEEDESLV